MKIKKEFLTSVFIIVVFLVGIFFLARNSQKNITNEINQDASLTEDSMPLIITEEDHIIGNKDAKVIIVEYSDTECPFCKMFHDTMKRVIAEKGNEIAWVYRHFPIKSKSFKESLATECAYEQKGNDGFWQYINTIYEITPSNDGLDPQELYKIAQNMNLNMEQFNTCIDNETYAQKIYSHMSSGDFLEVEGTPTSFILVDGEIVDTIPGAQDYERVIAKINSLLK